VDKTGNAPEEILLKSCRARIQTSASFLWFYREVSQESHLSFPGLAVRGSLLEAAEKDMPQSRENLEQYKSVQAIAIFMMMLAICSELEEYFKFGLRDRLLVKK
jgi:hypothetical protein